MVNFVFIVPEVIHGARVSFSEHCALSEDVIDTGTTAYLPFNGPSPFIATALRAGMVMTRAGTIRNLTLDVDLGPGGPETITAVLFVNGVATALAVALTGAVTFGQDLLDQIAVVAGDVVCYQVTVSIGGNATWVRISSELHVANL